MSSPTYDCTACGACCFGGHDRYIALLPEDRARAVPLPALTEIDGRRYLTMTCGHCAQLTATPDARLVCGIYEDRPEACRAFRAGSFECLKARQHRGAEAAALMAFATAETQPAPPLGAAPVVAIQAGGVAPEGPVSPSP